MSLEKYKFYAEINVRYEETDAMSVVYYGKYFVFFEVARTDYLKNIGYSYPDIEKEGLYFVVAEANCKYISSARYDDNLRIYTRVEYVRNSSFNFTYHVVKSGESGFTDIAQGNTVLVCVDSANFKPKRMPDYLREAVISFENI